MAKLRINGDSSGYVDLEAPNAASSSTLDLDQVPQKNAANTFSANTQVITAASNAEALHIKGRSSDDIGQIKFMGNDGLDSAGRLDARTTKFEMASYSELHLSANGPNNAHLKIDASGRVTMPAQPAFSFRISYVSAANYTGGAAVISNNVGTTYANVGNHFSASTGRFTAPVAGYYVFGACVRYDAFSGNYFYITLHKNAGLFVARHLSTATGSYLGATITAALTLAAGDYVYLVAQSSGDTAVSIDGDSNFFGYLVG